MNDQLEFLEHHELQSDSLAFLDNPEISTKEKIKILKSKIRRLTTLLRIFKDREISTDIGKEKIKNHDSLLPIMKEKLNELREQYPEYFL